jgi:hypothetical protein
MPAREIGHLIQKTVEKYFKSSDEFPTVVAEPGT